MKNKIRISSNRKQKRKTNKQKNRKNMRRTKNNSKRKQSKSISRNKHKKMTKIKNKLNNNTIILDMSGGAPPNDEFNINFNGDNLNNGTDFINTIMALSNIQEEEKDLFRSMLYDYNEIMGTISWNENKEFIRYVSNSGNPEQNISNNAIEECKHRLIETCLSDDKCKVYGSNAGIRAPRPKCVPKDSIIKFTKGQYIVASKRNIYEIVDSIQMVRLKPIGYIRLFKRKQLYNEKPIYLIINPFGQSEYPTDELNEYIRQIIEFIKQKYTDNKNSLFFISGHSMGGAITQTMAYSLIETEYVNNIRMIMTSSIMGFEPNTDNITKFNDKYNGKYLSLGLSFQMKDKQGIISVTDGYLFKGFNSELDKYKNILKGKKEKEEPITIINTVIIKGSSETIFYNSVLTTHINIKEIIPLVQLIMSPAFDFDKNGTEYLIRLIHTYNSYFKGIIRASH
jgi:hypothetical protein